MQFCWHTDPKARPSFKKVLETLEQCCASMLFFFIRQKNKFFFFLENIKADINFQMENNKAKWDKEIEIVFDRLKKVCLKNFFYLEFLSNFLFNY